MEQISRTSRRPTQNSTMGPRPIYSKIQAVLRREMVREFLAEFLSTFVMMVFGLGSVAHMVLKRNEFGSFLGVNLGFGLGVTMGIHVAGGISGAHMNAALTFTSCALGRMPWRKFPVYVLGQFLGSFLAAASIFLLFYTAINDFSGGDLLVTGQTATANIFATYLPLHMTLWRGFVDEVFLTMILQMCVLAITDKENNPAQKGMEALSIGLLVSVIGISLGMNTGYAINPSRDLPPRVFTYFAGWSSQVFRDGDSWWWVPVVAPILGAYLGGIMYLGVVFIHSTIPQDPQRLESSTAEDRRMTIASKGNPAVASPLTPGSITSGPIQVDPTLSGSMPLQRF